MERNIAALLDQAAYTIGVQYQANNSSGTYTYVTNLPDIKAGDYIIVPTHSREPLNRPRTVKMQDINMAGSVDEMTFDINDPTDMFAVNTRLSVAIVVSVGKTVDIEPNADIEYSWVISKLELTGYAETMKRNKAIVAAVNKAYTVNLRKSFAQRILGDMEEADKGELLKLLGK